MTKRYEKIAFVASAAPQAQEAFQEMKRLYPSVDPDDADVIVAIGGDGEMLRALHQFMGTSKPIFGINRGSVGFLMNEYRTDNLIERIEMADRSITHPLLMVAWDIHGQSHTARAINEVSMLRQTYQAAKLSISIDGKERLPELIADGLLVATPIGSSAYNLSVDGPILPLNSPLLALTPISAFRPRRWRGALLPDRVSIVINITDPESRLVSAVADHTEINGVSSVEISMDDTIDLVMLHDPNHSLDERIVAEQFGS
ncbi:NAD kinase [Microvirga sp. W0021]|uniref:NAD kinase n=1 Tax=Hohaiivirga grylli TaxID=3133970 RepID=A0ABV0BMV9_9HYPH